MHRGPHGQFPSGIDEWPNHVPNRTRQAQGQTKRRIRREAAAPAQVESLQVNESSEPLHSRVGYAPTVLHVLIVIQIEPRQAR